MSLLRVEHLSKHFGQIGGKAGAGTIEVLGDVSFEVSNGELLTIVGPSGSGKSTLLNIIAQIDTASSGKIWFDNKVILDGHQSKLDPGIGRHIGYVTQDDTLLPWRTMIENVSLPLHLQGVPLAEQHRRAEPLIRAAGLTGYESHYPHQLSGGMRKRALLIRTLIYDPPVILMDEPFGALDAQTRSQLQADLLNLWQIARKTIVFVTHDINEAIALGDRVLVLSRQPTRVLGATTIPYPRPRDLERLMTWPSYSSLYDAIRGQIH